MTFSSWICVWTSSKRPTPACFLAWHSANSEYRASALDQADQDCNHCQNQQHMNEPTQRVRADHTQQPENQKQHRNRPEHSHSPFVKLCTCESTALEFTYTAALAVSSKASSEDSI